MPATPAKKRTSPGRPTREASEELLRHTLEVAQGEFISRGFDGTSIEGIALAAGTSKLTLYRHFEGKKGLFIAVIEELASQYARQQMDKIDTTLPPEQVLLDMGRFLASYYFKPEIQRLVRMMIGDLRRVEGLPLIATRFADLSRSPVESYLAQLQSRKMAHFADIRRAAIQFVNLCMLGQYFLLCEENLAIPDARTQDEIVRSAVHVFTAAYLVPAESAEIMPD